MNTISGPDNTLGILIFASGCLVLGLALVLAGRSFQSRPGVVASLIVLALLLGSTLTVRAIMPSRASWLALAALTAIWSAGLLFHRALLSCLASSLVRRVGPTNLLALLLVGLGVGSPLAWSRWQERQIEEYDGQSALLAQMGAPQHDKVAISGLTDRGRAIPLHEIHVDVDATLMAEVEDRHFASAHSTMVRTALPNPECNCHGWVFADGHYWVDGDDVKNILEDNGYYLVDSPEVDDLIVYFSGDDIVHSGVVRSVESDGSMLIESKWGMNSRVLHSPADQPHWQEWQFYHSSRREGHCLLLPGVSGPSNLPQSKPLLTAQAR